MKKLYVLFFLISLYSCEKENYTTVVNGKVSNSETGTPIKDYILEIQEQKAELFAWSYHLA